MKVGVADLPLHYGTCPSWLFERMKKLGRALAEIIVLEYGKREFLRRISDPFWFQAFSCVLGFDWHSSGVTTTVTAALKEADLKDLGIAVLGGKGKASKKTLDEINELAEVFSLSTKRIEQLKRISKLVAKVDNNALQDGFMLYHHSFIVSEDGRWCVIQQGMNIESRYARRYHWLSEKIKSFVEEPHVAICCDFKTRCLNMVAKESKEARKCSVDLVKDNPMHLQAYISPSKEQKTLLKYLHMPQIHTIELKNYSGLMNAFEEQPKNYEELLLVKGMGAKTVRALALISNLVFGAEVSWRDPVKYSFAHGGKDGHPYPVDKSTYDESIEILEDTIKQAKLNDKEKMDVLKNLKEFFHF
ncbi:MAG: DUF763 domain-containing protein [Nitrososphaerota archaeon]|nr:DUF763 domain-containing protein [Nitrososphaerota archaeon]